MEQDLGHDQLRLGESGFLPELERGRQRPIEMKGPYLDPLNPQTKYSSALWMALQKPAVVVEGLPGAMIREYLLKRRVAYKGSKGAYKTAREAIIRL